MARARTSDASSNGHKPRPPARTPEAREDQLAMAAYDLAEEQITNGTASSQVITHFLKAGSRRERMEQLRMEHEIELMEVKKQQLEGQKRVEELFVHAINAMRSYQGGDPAELDEGHGPQPYEE
jgi:hypothetical protein